MKFLIISTVFLWSIQIFIFFLVIKLYAKSNRKFSYTEQDFKIINAEKGKIAPEFIGKKFDGKDIRLSSFIGSEVIFLFISPFCGTCIDELPYYKRLQQQARKSNLLFYLACIGTLNQTKELIEKYQVAIPCIALPKENSFNEIYKLRGTPAFLLIDKKGIIKASGWVHELEEELYSK